jgi:hypothetical protein
MRCGGRSEKARASDSLQLGWLGTHLLASRWLLFRPKNRESIEW